MVRIAAAVTALLLATPALAHARDRAPGAPGGKADWARADKQGFGTSTTRASRVWFTLREAELTEVFYPDLSHPSARHLVFMVDGRRVRTGAVAPDKLSYTQTSETGADAAATTMPTAPTAIPRHDGPTTASQRERRRRILDATLALATKGGYEAVQMRAVAEKAEVAVIEGFLPAQMDEEETKTAIDKIVAETGASSVKDMGRVMALLKERHAGQLDMSKASGLVKAALS